MNPDDWKRIEPLADAALEMEPAARAAFLETLRAEDAALCRELEAFLATEEGSRDFLTGPVEQRHAALLHAMGEEDGPRDGLAEGERVGAYRLVREIGRGGMGAVFLAERADGHFDQRVALKLVKRGMDSAEILERFRAERQILARLEHPHIARLLDGGVSDSRQPYFALEHVDGEPLTAHAARLALPLAERLRLFLQVCDAVEYAHRSLVVHRDLKPSNILVTADGQVKLLDFGIAKVLDPDLGDGSVTRGELRALTPRYAAPEQLRGEPVTTATDVYSLGVVLYELVGERHPYRLADTGRAEVEKAALTQEPEPLAGVGDLDHVVRMALRKEPERRYGSVRALAEDLRRHLDGRPVAARPDTFRYRAGKFVRRHRAGVAAAVLVIVSLAAGLVATLWQAREAVRQARKAEEVTKFTLSLFEVASPDASKGREITARELLERGTRRISSELRGQPELEAQMLLVMGSIQHRLGLENESRPLYERALALRRSLHGDDHLAVAEAEVALGGALVEAGEPAKAKEVLEHALGTRERRLGRDHPDTAFVRGRLGRALLAKGDLSGAESLLAAAVAVARGRPEPQELAANLQALGSIHHARADWKQAERFYTEALAIRRRAFGDEHSAVLSNRVSLAALKQDQGDLRGAEDSYRRILDVERRLLGPTHVSVAVTYLNLANVLTNAGKYTEAEPLLREALEIHRRAHGADSPRLGPGLHNLARVLRPQGRLAEAEAASRQALRLVVPVLGEDHVNVAVARDALARTLTDAGRLPEAESLVRASLAVYGKHLPSDHPRLAEGRLTLARVLMAAGRDAEAEPLVREALRLRQERFGVDDWRTAEARAVLDQLRRGPPRASRPN